MPPNRNLTRKASAAIDEKRLYWEMGYRVRIAREVRHMTQADLAKHTGLSRASIANLEGGRQRSPLTVLYRVAHALRTKPTRLLPNLSDVLITTTKASR